MMKVLRYCNIFFRLRMYLVKKHSINGMKKFIDGYIGYYNTQNLSTEMQKLMNENVNRFVQEMHELEVSIDQWVYNYTHSINL